MSHIVYKNAVFCILVTVIILGVVYVNSHISYLNLFPLFCV